MKWAHAPQAKYGDSRVIRRFLLVPRSIHPETRWLEFATIRQEYCSYYWVDREWVDT